MSKVLAFTSYGGPEHQEMIDRPVPEPGPGRLTIEVRAAGVNPADWKVREGRMGRRWTTPVPMGLEAAGVVVAVGAGVTDFAVGDEVLGPVAIGVGGLAEHTVLDASTAVEKPEDVSFADAAALPVAGSTAYDATHQIELDAGQSLLIIGAGGGVGRMAAQIASVHQFRVIGVAGADKRELVESTGATFVESGDDVAERARAAAPDGVDLVIDLVGGDTLRALAPIAKRPSLVISATDAETVRELGGAVLERSPESLEKITGVVEAGLVDPTVTSRYTLDDAAQAIAEVEAGHATGKVVVEP